MTKKVLSVVVAVMVLFSLNNYSYGETVDPNNIILSTSPQNSEINVSLDPLIKISFTHEIQFLDSSKSNYITLTSNEGAYLLDNSGIEIGGTGNKELLINIMDERDGVFNLKKNTEYTLTISPNMVRLVGVTDISGNEVKNKEIQLVFTTTGDGSIPNVVKYSSNENFMDDITKVNETQLSKDGYIYIRFDQNINEDIDVLGTLLNDRVKINKKLKSFNEATVAESVYNPDFNFINNNDNYSYTSKVEYFNIESIEHINDYLKIKPTEILKENSSYRLFIDKKYIEDTHGINISNNIDTVFYVKAASDNSTINYSLNNGESNFDKTYYTQPIYNSTTPMEIRLDREVIPLLSSERYDTVTSGVYEDSLKNITIFENYNEDIKAPIKEIKLNYYLDGSNKKSKLYIYPNENLKSGLHYKLSIPEGTFETIGGVKSNNLIYSFVTASNEINDKGIDKLEDNEIKVIDLKNTEKTFNIIGHNFNERISKVVLIPFSGNAPNSIDIDSSYVEFDNSTKLKVHIRDSIRDELSKDTNTGKYKVKVVFQNGDEIISSDNELLYIVPKDKPVVVRVYPTNEGVYDENQLKHDVIDDTTKDKFFVKVTFNDIDNTLKLNKDNLNAINIHSLNGSENVLDKVFMNSIISDTEKTNKYIYVKNESSNEVTIYIPILKLSSNNSYVLDIPSNLVYYGGADNVIGNESVSFNFKTKDIPNIDKISIGSVPEDYDDYDIYIYGKYFSSDVEVYFNEEKARDVDWIDDKTLKVELPSDLDVGIYDVIIKNGENHKATMYGSISIIQEGDHVPNENY
ncbi:Ig-like domain-containing protein, partial [Anaeromicrobium sediminis]